ncbi:MAG TPA: YgdI/YgdR family lipoprotein [Verrucomicrobiae bacterium]|jgi:hypothetical protein|nr:YgdI/YgdR family lipoprotein [Verrucomicrobiae bacterium]
MKSTISILLGATLLAGCARYDMTLTNGVHLTNISKPKLDEANEIYVYKDVAGNKRFIHAGRVVEIVPHSSKSETAFLSR